MITHNTSEKVYLKFHTEMKRYSDWEMFILTVIQQMMYSVSTFPCSLMLHGTTERSTTKWIMMSSCLRMYYNNKIFKWSNKCKTTWNIIKELSRKQHSKTDSPELLIDSKHLRDQQDMTDAFNSYFLYIIDKISKNNVDNMITDKILSTFHYDLGKINLITSHLWFLKLFQPKKLHL
jgi:hypothetical protein